MHSWLFLTTLPCSFSWAYLEAAHIVAIIKQHRHTSLWPIFVIIIFRPNFKPHYWPYLKSIKKWPITYSRVVLDSPTQILFELYFQLNINFFFNFRVLQFRHVQFNSAKTWGWEEQKIGGCFSRSWRKRKWQNHSRANDQNFWSQWCCRSV